MTRSFECANCFEPVGVDNLKRLVIPVITGHVDGLDVHFEGRWLCGECYEDFYYFLLEGWDDQLSHKVRPLKPAAARSISQDPGPAGEGLSNSSERGQPQDQKEGGSTPPPPPRRSD